MQHRIREKGFTLIELLVVIAIIGILAGVVLTSLNTARQKARDTQDIAAIKDAQLILEFEFDASDKYPADQTAFEALSGIGASTKIIYASASDLNYHMGIVLEDAGSVPADDADDTTEFDGNSTDCAGGAGDDLCYDITN